mmetsp:Transcript_8395/g.13049  ORF Transcript_8395/g.13049 Transcript_8395/m.13049 type:complete len:289 (-) Transcript_8395:41-907(-)
MNRHKQIRVTITKLLVLLHLCVRSFQPMFRVEKYHDAITAIVTQDFVQCLEFTTAMHILFDMYTFFFEQHCVTLIVLIDIALLVRHRLNLAIMLANEITCHFTFRTAVHRLQPQHTKTTLFREHVDNTAHLSLHALAGHEFVGAVHRKRDHTGQCVARNTALLHHIHQFARRTADHVETATQSRQTRHRRHTTNQRSTIQTIKLGDLQEHFTRLNRHMTTRTHDKYLRFTRCTIQLLLLCVVVGIVSRRRQFFELHALDDSDRHRHQSIAVRHVAMYAVFVPAADSVY